MLVKFPSGQQSQISICACSEWNTCRMSIRNTVPRACSVHIWNIHILVDFHQKNHRRVQIDCQWPHSGVNSIMMVHTTQPDGGRRGGGVHALSLSLHLPSRTKLWRTLQLRWQIHSSYYTLSIYRWKRCWIKDTKKRKLKKHFHSTSGHARNESIMSCSACEFGNTIWIGTRDSFCCMYSCLVYRVALGWSSRVHWAVVNMSDVSVSAECIVSFLLFRTR